MALQPAGGCPTDILVDLGTEDKKLDEEQESKDAPATPPEATKTQPERPKALPAQSNSSPKRNVEEELCGYLLKVNQGGLMKGSKNRWFVFRGEDCTLSYYRSPKDANGSALGSIPISNCAFTCTAEGLLHNAFQITVGARSYILQACDQKTMLWWLQELQMERRIYNMKHHHHSGAQKQAADDTGLKKSYEQNDQPTPAGLLDKTNPAESFEVEKVSRDSLSVIPVLPRIENPPDTVGLKSANLVQPKSGMGITSGLSDIGNKVTQLGGGITKMRIKPARPAPPVGASVFYGKRQTDANDENLTIGPALKAKGAEPKHKGPLSRTTAGFSHLLDKIQNAAKTGKAPHGDSKHLEEINETLTLVREEMELMKTSLESKEETIQLLKKELDKYSTISTYNATTSIADGTPQVTSSASTNHQMRSELTTLKLTIEHLREEIDETKLLLKQQQEKTTLFQEMLQVKDGIVVQLTNELYEMERSYKSVLSEYEGFKRQSKEEFVIVSPAPTEGQNTAEGQHQNEQSSEASKRLRDEVEGYKLQNKFLNNEILELTHLRKTDREKMDTLHDKILHQEALHCQLQSKYFILLAEMDRTRSQTLVYPDGENPLLAPEKPGTSGPNVVRQLIQEAIKEGETRAAEISASFKSTKYDKYGFTQIVDDGDESTFLSAASRLEQHASNIVNSIEQHDASVALKWQKYLSENKEWQRNAEFKSLVRLGVPHDLRHRVWRYLVHIRTHEIRQTLNADGTYYTRLTETDVAPLHAKQIDLDLLRTLPSNRYFATMDCIGIQQLKRVLGAYSLHNPSIGYCQGLNRIAAVALLYLGEEDAFWCLVAIVESIMPAEYYSLTLTASQVDQRVFRDLLAEKMPRVHRHLESLGVDISLISFNWFLCVYCDNVPPETMFKIWDVFLNESSKILFRYGLAFFKHIEDDILELNEYMTLFNLLRRMVHRMYDSRTLSQIAFQGMNPFPMRKVHRLRLVYLEKVRGELHQLDVLRKEFASRRNKASNSDMYSDDEEGDSA